MNPKRTNRCALANSGYASLLAAVPQSRGAFHADADLSAPMVDFSRSMLRKYRPMKHTIIAIATLVMLVGCAAYNQTSFSHYQGQSEYTGRGGTVKNVDGIDIWTSGEPNRRFQIVGVIDQSHYNNNSVMSFVAGMSKDSELIATAKKQGGDAIIFIGSDSVVTGYKYSGPSSAYGNARVDPNTSTSTRAAVIKYLR